MRKSVIVVAALIVLSRAAPAVYASGGTVIRQNFSNPDNWKPLRFDKKKKNTVYSAVDVDGVTCLRAESVDSSSALLCNKEFNVYQYPMIRWKWKISNVYKKGDVSKKRDNDSPARLYIMFKYDPEKAGLFTRLKYMIAKKIYGRYPPRYAICYIWANRRHGERIITSPGFGAIKYVVVEAGSGKAGKWRQEEVNILKDFKEAFGKPPPPTAAISFMDDSDDTGGRSTAWLSSLEVMKEQVPPAGAPVAIGSKDNRSADQWK